MRITNTGNVGIGTTAPKTTLHVVGVNNEPAFITVSGNAGNLSALSIYNNGDATANNVNRVFFFNNGGTAQCSGGAGCWTSTSDAALKKDVRALASGLGVVERMRPVRFKWKKDGREDIGFIAQEMKPVVPEVVKGEEGRMSIGYAGLVPVLARAIQEQQAEIESLKAELKALKGTVGATR